MDCVVGTFEKWDLNLLSFSLHTDVPWKEKYAVGSQILKSSNPYPTTIPSKHDSPVIKPIDHSLCQSKLQNATENNGSNCKEEKTYDEC
jgi:hypothetical protein